MRLDGIDDLSTELFKNSSVDGTLSLSSWCSTKSSSGMAVPMSLIPLHTKQIQIVFIVGAALLNRRTGTSSGRESSVPEVSRRDRTSAA